MQRCIVHQVSYTTKFVNYKDMKPFVKDLKAIYQAPSEEMALEKLDEQGKKAVYDFGIALGIAFQLQDDLFDCYGDVKVFGKLPGGDIADNKKTYLYLKALELASDDDKRRLEDFFKMPKGRDDAKMKAVLEIFDKYNVRQIVTDVMTNYYENSLRHLDSIALPEERKTVLRNYASSLYNRIK